MTEITSTAWDRLTRLTTPVGMPITLTEAKAELKVESAADDSVISRKIGEVTEAIDGPNGIGIALMSSQWRLSLDIFPTVIELPLVPVISVDVITYVDTAGNSQTLPTADYQVDLGVRPARICAAFGKSFPIARSQPSAIQVDFTAGYAQRSEIPADLRGLLFWMLTNSFENRSPVVIGTVGSELPLGAQMIIDRHRVGRFA